MKGQDLLVLVAIMDAFDKQEDFIDGKPWKIKTLSDELKLGLSAVHRSISHCQQVALLDSDNGRVNVRRFFEFAIHSLGILFPVEVKGPTSGIATTLSAGIFPSSFAIQAGEHEFVWPSAVGEHNGLAIEPIHKSAPFLAISSRYSHRILAAFDSIRLERPREKNLASEYLRSLYR